MSPECPTLLCMHQVTEPGACCPRCRGSCYTHTHTLTAFTSPQRMIRVLILTACVCVLGCMYDGEEYVEGSSWFADSTPCRSCMCVEGVTTCSEVRCLSPCINTISVPGECCPLCAGRTHTHTNLQRDFQTRNSSLAGYQDTCVFHVCLSLKV